MKRVLITGANSYIGENVSEWLCKDMSCYKVDAIDMHTDSWKSHSFSNYDVVFHVAGIAHADVDKVAEETVQLYMKVNCDLAYECALKAKGEGVKQFIFMSSMIVYPNATKLGVTNVITKGTVPNPDNFYGNSKLQAEIKLSTLIDESFKLVILRPPMIYGRNSKGNYRSLARMARKLPIFPNISNQRSMIYIENFCEFVKLMIDNEEEGIFFPQNSEYTNTVELVRMIAETTGRKIFLTKVFNPFLRIISCIDNKYGKLVNKAFGSLTYDMSMSEYRTDYRLYNLKESIERTEG